TGMYSDPLSETKRRAERARGLHEIVPSAWLHRGRVWLISTLLARVIVSSLSYLAVCPTHACLQNRQAIPSKRHCLCSKFTSNVSCRSRELVEPITENLNTGKSASFSQTEDSTTLIFSYPLPSHNARGNKNGDDPPL